MIKKRIRDSVQDELTGFTKVGEVLEKFKTGKKKKSLPLEFTRDKYISYEFQKYGYELAKELGDLKNKSLYIKLAKETPRGLLEAAKNFVKDANNVDSPPKLYMWKLTQLRQELKNKKLKKIEGD